MDFITLIILLKPNNGIRAAYTNACFIRSKNFRVYGVFHHLAETFLGFGYPMVFQGYTLHACGNLEKPSHLDDCLVCLDKTRNFRFA